MADLFFRVNADYTELVAMQAEADRLKAQLSNFSGSKEEFAELTNRAAQLDAAIQRLAESGIKNAETAFSNFAQEANKSIGGVDFSTFAKGAEESAEAAKSFGEAWLAAQDSATSKDMDSVISNVKENMRALQSIMIDVQNAMNSTNNSAAQAALGEYMNELMRLRDFYNEIGLAAKQMKEDMASPATGQNNEVEALEVSKQRAELLERMQSLYDAEIQKQQRLGNEYDKAAAALGLYKQQYVAMLSQGGSKEQLSGLKENIAVSSVSMQALETQIEQSKTRTGELKTAMGEVKTNTQMSSVEAAQLALQFDTGANNGMRLRTEMMMAREQMARMMQDGQTNSLQFIQLAEKAGELRRVFTAASAKMNYYANPAKGFATTTAALQGMAGAAKVAVGVYGLFNKKQEDLVKVQTTIQSLMAITSGLQAVYNLRSAKGAVMQGIMYVQDQLRKKVLIDLAVAQEMENTAMAHGAVTAGVETAAKEANTGATVKLTIAQRAYNMVANANPYVLLASALIAVGTAVWALASANSKAKKEEEERKKAAEERAKSEKAFTDTFVQDATKQASKYYELRMQWKLLKTEHEKNKFIKDNEQAFNDLGYAVSTVRQAEDLLINNTSAVVRAFQLRAQAAALMAKAENVWNTYYSKVDPNPKHRFYKQGDLVDFDKVKELNLKEDQHYRILWRSGKAKAELTLAGVMAANRAEQAKSQRLYNQQEAQAAKERDAGLAGINKQYVGVVSQIEANDKQINVPRYKPTQTTRTKKDKTGTSKGDDAIKNANDKIKQAEDDDAQILENQEKQRQQVIDNERKLTELRLNAMADGAAKTSALRKYNQQKEIEDIQKNYRERQWEEIKEARNNFDKQEDALAKQNKKYKRKNFYKSDEYKKMVTESVDANGNKVVNPILSPANQASMDAEITGTRIRQGYDNEKAQNQALKDLEKFLDKRITIEKKYAAEKAKIDDQLKTGTIDEDTANGLKDKLEDDKKNELRKVGFDDFKNSPAYQMAMAGTGVNYSDMQKAFEQLREKMADAATMSPSDFKAFADAYQQLSDKMVEANPFAALKQANEDLIKSEEELKKARQNAFDVYKEYGVDASGQELQGGKMEALHTEAQSADATVIAVQNDYNKAMQDSNATDEERLHLQQELDKATKAATKAEQAYSNAKRAVTNATQAANNAEARNNNAKKNQQKATEGVIKITKKWADAVKQAASMYKSPITDAITSVVTLASTTMDSIKAIKLASESTVKGINDVAMAVEKATAILAIIQAAWQLINTIMSLFSGNAKKKYEEQVASLKGTIDALDYSYSTLKDDMDDMWGTDALEQYIKTLDTLNDKQEKQMELIRLQASAHVGHKSLEYYQNKKSGLTDADWNEMYKWLQEQGWEVAGTRQGVLYNMTPEQLKAFMASGIGTKIMGALGGVKGTGDYSGSDWLKDMQDYANSAKDAEDLTDQLQEKLNGITFDSLKDKLKELVTTFDTSINDINNSFDDFMRESVYNSLREGYESELNNWYKELDALNKKRAEGMSDEEYRKELAKLRDKYTQITKKAQDDYQSALTEAGVNVKDVEQSSTQGGFESMSEDTGKELNGRFASLQEQGTITAMNTTAMVQQLGVVSGIADEIRTVQVNSYLSLQAIEENTRKVVEPILGMRDDIERIKKNTERL